MRHVHPQRLPAVVLMAAVTACPALAHDTGSASAADPAWRLMVPAARLGRFDLRIEHAEFTGSVSQVAARVTETWGDEPWMLLREDGEAGPVLSRLTPTGIETIDLRPGANGRVQARRSFLDWRGSRADRTPLVSEPVFIAALAELGEPLSGLASVDGDVGNLTRVWLVPGDIAAVARRVERIAASHGLAPLMRFDAPVDAPEAVRGGRVTAFGGPGLIAVLTFTRQGAGVAVVVHCRERAP